MTAIWIATLSFESLEFTDLLAIALNFRFQKAIDLMELTKLI